MKVTSFPIIQLMKKGNCLFRADRSQPYLTDSDGLLRKIIRITEKVWRSDSCSGPLPPIFSISSLFRAREKLPKTRVWCDTSKEGKWKEKYFRFMRHLRTIHFMNCVTAVQFRNRTASHCNQVPIYAHSINLLPVDHMYLAAVTPPTHVKQTS